MDDYPTGVRPILDDLSSLHDVLSQIDAAGLPFHLGVVPALLDERMSEFLRGLPSLVVSMHGFEHGYAKHSQILLKAADPLNQRGTVTASMSLRARPTLRSCTRSRMGVACSSHA